MTQTKQWIAYTLERSKQFSTWVHLLRRGEWVYTYWRIDIGIRDNYILWAEALYSAVAKILMGDASREGGVDVVWSWRSESRQLMFFVLGAKGTGISLRLRDGTFVPEGFALTSCSEGAVLGTRGFIGMLSESGWRTGRGLKIGSWE